MAWTYDQSSGALSYNGNVVGTGYSGHWAGLNDPGSQNLANVGPIPQGRYTIGPPHTPVDHLGPLALPLYPDPANQMFGRFGFFIHGDNAAENHTASNGCIILGPAIRAQIDASGDKTLIVV